MQIKKVTVDVPADVLKKAQDQTGESISETIRMALTLLASFEAQKELANLRGKVKVKETWQQLKADRR